MPSAFLANHRALIGTALTAPAANEYPQSSTFMYWPSGVSGPWPSGDLGNYNKHKEMWGDRDPQMVRLYNNNPGGTTGVNGSAGSYGLISSDHRAIANDGCFLNYSFKYGGAGTSAWQTLANNLNATGDNADKQAMRNAAQNVRRHHLDAGNTALIKKIMLGYHHEPDNDGGTAASWIAAFRAIITYFARRGIVDMELRPNVPLDTASSPGGAPGPLLDAVEWCATIVGDTDARFAFWPGDDWCRWMMNDPYCWGGGQSSPVGSGASVGRVPQPGDTSGTNYDKPWRALKETVGITALLKWSDAHPGVLLGLGEFATSEYIDKFTGGSNAVLRTPKVWNAIPAAKGDWYKGVAKMARGEGYTSPVMAGNSHTADARLRRIKAFCFWHDQAAMPRWFNTVPFQPGDINQPSTTGAARSLSYDGFVAMVNDTWFDAIDSGGPTVVDPTNLTLNAEVDASGREYTFTSTVTPGSGTVLGFNFAFGDGAIEAVVGVGPATVTHFYPTDGPRTVRVSVVTGDGGEAAREITINVTGRNEERPETEALSGAPLIVTGASVRGLRSIFNPAIEAVTRFAHERTTRHLLKSIPGTTYTLTVDDLGKTLEFTSSTAVTVTIPTNASVAFPIGGWVDMVQIGTGTVSLVGASGVTINRPALAQTSGQFSTIRARQRSVLNTWLLSGHLATGTPSAPPTEPEVAATVDDLFALDFNTGANGAPINAAQWSSHFGADAVYSIDALEGAFSARLEVVNGTSFYRIDFDEPLDLFWFSTYLKLDARPAANTYIAEWFNFNAISGVTAKIGDLRVDATGALTMRDNINAIPGLTSPALTPAAWARASVKADPGSATGHTLRTYTGTDLHGTDPTFDQSGAATANGQTLVTGVRFGVMAAGTIAFRFDRLRGNSAVEPAPFTG